MICNITKHSGFCPGCKAAVNAAYDFSKSENLVMLGEVVHNPIVINDLVKNRHVKVISEKDLCNLNENKTVLIRAHGVKKSIIEKIKSKNANIIDKTCPKVRRVQRIVNESLKKNNKIIIIGDPNHPEVIGINGWCGDSAIIIESLEKFEKFLKFMESNIIYTVVFQTTFNFEKSKVIVKSCDRYQNIVAYNTVCNDTFLRQQELNFLSKQYEMVIIIGGKNSSNCTKLFQIAKSNCKNSYYIENSETIKNLDFSGISKVLLCGGASTPIESILEISEFFKKRHYNSC